MIFEEVSFRKIKRSEFDGLEDETFISCTYTTAKTAEQIIRRQAFIGRSKKTEIGKYKWGKFEVGNIPWCKKTDSPFNVILVLPVFKVSFLHSRKPKSL